MRTAKLTDLSSLSHGPRNNRLPSEVAIIRSSDILRVRFTVRLRLKGRLEGLARMEALKLKGAEKLKGHHAPTDEDESWSICIA